LILLEVLSLILNAQALVAASQVAHESLRRQVFVSEEWQNVCVPTVATFAGVDHISVLRIGFLHSIVLVLIHW
tara:strand:+ start:150 stop:368 length:219 start_codon:yes stop_codon:yes gene_type:complete